MPGVLHTRGKSSTQVGSRAGNSDTSCWSLPARTLASVGTGYGELILGKSAGQGAWPPAEGAELGRQLRRSSRRRRAARAPCRSRGSVGQRMQDIERVAQIQALAQPGRTRCPRMQVEPL